MVTISEELGLLACGGAPANYSHRALYGLCVKLLTASTPDSYSLIENHAAAFYYYLPNAKGAEAAD